MSFRHSKKIAGIGVFPIRAAGGVSPKMSLGSMPTRPALLVRINDSDGCCGWGEVWANFPPRANIHKAHIIEDVIAAHLDGLTFVEPREVQIELRQRLMVYFLHVGQVQVFEHILAGIDTALWDLSLRAQGVSFAEFMDLRQAAANSYASSINAEDIEDLIPRHSGLGQVHFKLKIGFAGHGNREIVERAARICPPGARIMVDSNQSWTLDQAIDALRSIEDFSPFFAEEALPANAPKPAWEKLAKSTGILLAGGENIYGISDFLSMTDAGLRVIQPDVAKWGGMTGALDLARALPGDVLLWPHFMGTAIGQMAALSVSAAIGETSACEVDVNQNVMRTELCGDAITIRKGRVKLPQYPGLASPPEPEQLDRFTEAAAGRLSS